MMIKNMFQIDYGNRKNGRVLLLVPLLLISLLFVGACGSNGNTVELSEEEKKADAILAEMKKEADALYPDTVPYGIIDWGADSVYHKGLYNFCKSLPKGGDLHVHDDKFIPVDKYIDILKNHGGVYINLKDGPEYGYMYVNSQPEGTVLLNDALEQGLLTDEDLLEILVMSEKDVANGRWTSFENIFSTLRDISGNAEMIEDIYEEGFRNCCENKIYLLETRVIFVTDDDAENAKILNAIRNAYYRVKAECPDFVVRVIGATGKNDFFQLDQAFETLRSVIRLSKTIKDEYEQENPKDFIIGLDLVNEEDSSKSLEEYIDFFDSDEVKKSGLKLFLHAGESLRMDNVDVNYAHRLGAVRVGHAFNLYRFPELMEKYKEDNIAIEVCPISNYRLGYTSDLRLHPGYTYLQAGIPVVICSDDGTFLTKMPLVDDFYAVILSWDLGIGDIKKLCRNAIEYSGLPEEDKAVIMNKWEKDWEEYISDFVHE